MTPPTVEEIKTEVLADPDNRLALSIYNFACKPDAREKGLFVVGRFIRSADPAALDGDLAANAARFSRAQDILDEKTTIYRMGFFNLQRNLDDYENEDLCAWVTDQEARDIVAAILDAVPALDAEVKALDAVAPF